MLSFAIILTTTILVVVCLLLILLVLMQRPKQEGLGAAFGAGVTDQIWGSQTTNVLQKGTVYLAVLFFGLSLVLTVLKARKEKELTGFKLPETAAAAAATPDAPDAASSFTPAPEFPVTPSVPFDPAPAVLTPETDAAAPALEAPGAAPAPAEATPAADAAPVEAAPAESTPAEPEPAPAGTP